MFPGVLLPLVRLHGEAHARRVRKVFADQRDEDVHDLGRQQVAHGSNDGVGQVGEVVRVLRDQVREDLKRKGRWQCDQVGRFFNCFWSRSLHDILRLIFNFYL